MIRPHPHIKNDRFLKAKLLFMHFKFTLDNGLETTAKKSSNLNLTLGENQMTEKHRLEPAVN